jgi:hypothetical protein
MALMGDRGEGVFDFASQPKTAGLGFPRCEHGWPLVYWRHAAVEADRGQVSSEVRLGPLAADVAIVLVALAVIVAAWEEWVRRQRQSPAVRFALALVVTVGVAAALGWWNVRQTAFQREAAAVAAIAEDHDEAYDFQYEYSPPLALHRLLGAKRLTPLCRVVGVCTSGMNDGERDRLARLGPHLAALSNCRRLRLSDLDGSDRDLAFLRGMPQLTDLTLERMPIDGSGLCHLAAPERLIALELASTHLSDAGLEAIAACRGLQTLTLSDTRISDAGLACLKQFPLLESLNLHQTGVGDASIDPIASLAGLKALYVQETRITTGGIARLRQALPDAVVLEGRTALEVGPPTPGRGEP